MNKRRKAPSPDGYMDRARLAAHLGIAPGSIARMVKDGHLPEPMRISARVVRWRLEDVEKHIGRNKREESDDPLAGFYGRS